MQFIQMAAAIAFAAANAQGIYGMKALAGGHFIKEAHQRFHYVLGLEGMHALAVGMLSKEEIKANFTLFNGGQADVASQADLAKRERKIQIMAQFCKGCGACVTTCPNQGIYLEDGKAKIKPEECILCSYCAAACPDFILRVV